MHLKTTVLFAVAALAFTSPAVAENPQPFDNPGVTADPPQGEVTTLKNLTLTFANYSAVFPNPYQYEITVTRYGENEVLMGGEAKTDDDRSKWNIVHVSLDQTIREPGNYVITFPEGFFQDWDYRPLPFETKLLYTVTGGTGEIDFKPYDNTGVCISPRQGIYNKIGEDFQLNFDYESVGYDNSKMLRMLDDETGECCGTFSVDYTFDDGYAVLNQFVLKSDREVTAPGSYTLVCPDGAFYRSSDSEDIGGFRFRYVVDENGQVYTPDPSYSFVNPSSGRTLRELENLVVTFPDYEQARPSLSPNIKVTNASGVEVAKGMPNASATKLGTNQIAVNIQPALTAEGEYTVTITEGSFIVGENGRKNSEIILHYTLKENAYDPDDPEGPYDNRGVTIYPEQGTYKSLNTFTLTFDCDHTGIDFSKMVMVYNDETGQIYGTCGIDYGANFGKEVIADVLPWMNKPGIYTIEFLKGTFYDYGDPEEPVMPAYKFRYIIDPNGQSVTPATENVVANPPSGSTIDPLKQLTVTFPDFVKIERNRTVDNLNVEIAVINEAGETVSVGLVNPNRTGLAPNEMQITFDPEVIYTNTYRIVFARRVFLLGAEGDQRYNEEFELIYKIIGLGIDTISSDDMNAPVEYFNLQGIRVADPQAGQLLMRRQGNKVEKIVF